MLILYIIFPTLIVGVFLFKWVTTHKCVEPAELFFEKICTGLSHLKFLDPLQNVRDCSKKGAIVDKLNSQNEYWCEKTMEKKTSFCTNYAVPILDNKSAEHFYLCIPYKKPIRLKCPEHLVFDNTTHSCIYKNSCFNEAINSKKKFSFIDFHYTVFDKTGVDLASMQHQNEKYYFICDGKNGIQELQSCREGYLFNQDKADCQTSTSDLGGILNIFLPLV